MENLLTEEEIWEREIEITLDLTEQYNKTRGTWEMEYTPDPVEY